MQLIQGDTLHSKVTIRNSDLTPVDITGAIVTFTIADKTGIIFSQPVDVIDPILGECQIKVAKEITNTWKVGVYCWEIQILGSSGDMTTSPSHKLSILPQLTPNE